MPRIRKLFAPLALALAAMVMALGCSSTGGSETIVPVTGIMLRAESLTTGRGCGRGATQIFKYAVVVLGRDPAKIPETGELPDPTLPIAGSLFDCFADGSFVDLPQAGGSNVYTLHVFAYNEAAYRAAGGDATIRGSATSASDPARRDGALSALLATNPTYTTTCDAHQVDLVQALAVCAPLGVGGGATATPAVVQLSLGSIDRTGGMPARCDVDFTTVRSRYRVGSGAPSETSELACSQVVAAERQPATITVSPATAPATYTFELALLRKDGTELGRTTCAADTSPGITSSAICRPLP